MVRDLWRTPDSIRLQVGMNTALYQHLIVRHVFQLHCQFVIPCTVILYFIVSIRDFISCWIISYDGVREFFFSGGGGGGGTAATEISVKTAYSLKL